MENPTLEEKYIIIDFGNSRFKADHGWTTNREYAKEFSKDEVHPAVQKLREQKFSKITFKKVPPPPAETKRAKHLKAVKNAVKLEIEAKEKILEGARERKNKRLTETTLTMNAGLTPA